VRLAEGGFGPSFAKAASANGLIAGHSFTSTSVLLWPTADDSPLDVHRLSCAAGRAPAQFCRTGTAPTLVRVTAVNARGQLAGAADGIAVVWSPLTSDEAALVAANSGRCLDVLGASSEPGTPLVIYDCHGGENQRFVFPPPGTSGEIRVMIGGAARCVDAWAGAGADGTPLVAWPCHGGENQRWTRTAGGVLHGIGGKCIDVQGARADNLAPVWLWTCHGGTNQRWERDPTWFAAR
jgi:hypothetical protein